MSIPEHRINKIAWRLCIAEVKAVCPVYIRFPLPERNDEERNDPSLLIRVCTEHLCNSCSSFSETSNPLIQNWLRSLYFLSSNSIPDSLSPNKFWSSWCGVGHTGLSQWVLLFSEASLTNSMLLCAGSCWRRWKTWTAVWRSSSPDCL